MFPLNPPLSAQPAATESFVPPLLVNRYYFDELHVIHGVTIPLARGIEIPVFANDLLSWALVNLVLSVLGVILTAIITVRRARQKTRERSKPYYLIVARVAGAGGAVLFFATQAIAGATMVLLDTWSPIHIGLLGIIVVASIKAVEETGKAEDNMSDTDTPEEGCKPFIEAEHKANTLDEGREPENTISAQ